MVKFNIIENASDDRYLKYVELYNDGLKVREIGEILDISPSTLTTYFNHARDDGLITPRKIPRKKSSIFLKPKYYCMIKNGFYKVYSPTINRSRQSNFGVYTSEAEAKYVVDELKKVNWNRRCLKNIQIKAAEIFH